MYFVDEEDNIVDTDENKSEESSSAESSYMKADKGREKSDDNGADKSADIEGDESADEEEMSEDEQAMMDAWESMASDEAKPVKNKEEERLLNQDEIDSLLGFDDEKSKKLSGIEVILNSSKVTYERLPMLEMVFDRMIRSLTTSLRNFTSDNVDIQIDNIRSSRFGDFMNSLPLPAMIGVFQAKQWQDSSALIVANSDLIYAIVDVLLGGRKTTTKVKVDGRAYTSIEISILTKMFNIILTDFSDAFEPVEPVTFELDRVETNPSFVTITRPVNVAIVVTFNIQMENRGGQIEMLIPYSSLETVRDKLLQMFMGERFGDDSIWESHLAREVWNTSIELTCNLGKAKATLTEILNWEPGDQIILDATPNSHVDLYADKSLIASAKMGRKSRNVAVQIEKFFIKKHNSEEKAS